jgi:hypothetical protein
MGGVLSLRELLPARSAIQVSPARAWGRDLGRGCDERRREHHEDREQGEQAEDDRANGLGP